MKELVQDLNDKRPFVGLKVIDITHVLAGPACTYLLAQMGAEVIKIEEPGSGDTVRNRGGSIVELQEQGMGTNFIAQNSNKQSIVIDLKTSQGQELVKHLIKDADIFVENHRGKTMDALGLSFDELKKINPRIIYCSMSGYGHKGPLGNAPAYDVNIQAASGMMSITGAPETSPVRTGAPILDYATGMSAAFAISTALFQRQQTGEGEYIDVSMLDTAFFLMCSTVTDYMISGNAPKPKGNSANSGLPTSGNFATKDGVLSIGLNEEHQFSRFATVADREDLLKDPRFASLRKRKENSAVVKKELQEILMTQSAVEWEDVLLRAGVPASRVKTIPEILASEHVQKRNVFTSFDSIDAIDQPLTVLKAPFKYGSANGPSLESPPPQLGEDTMSILENSGYSDEQIAELFANNIVA